MPNHFYPAEDSAKQLKIFNETLGLPEDARLPMPVKIGENSPGELSLRVVFNLCLCATSLPLT